MKKLLHNHKISLEINGKTYWLTPEQYEEIQRRIEDGESIDGMTGPVKEEASFYIPDFLKNKQVING